MQIAKFRITVKHDQGKANFIVTALADTNCLDREVLRIKAINQLMQAEGCPRRAIIGSRHLTTKTV